MDYKQRMTEYYPQVIRDIRDMQAIIRAEYPEFQMIANEEPWLLSEAYWLTMNEDRIEQWEKLLGISTLSWRTVEERRAILIDKLRGNSKLNTASIEETVETLTGGTAECSFSDSTIHVEITPPANDGTDMFPEVDKALADRVPAHIRLDVTRKLSTWEHLMTLEDTWGDVKNNYSSWRYVKTIVPKG